MKEDPIFKHATQKTSFIIEQINRIRKKKKNKFYRNMSDRLKKGAVKKEKKKIVKSAKSLHAQRRACFGPVDYVPSIEWSTK
jgi:hypothetical protein